MRAKQQYKLCCLLLSYYVIFLTVFSAIFRENFPNNEPN